MSLINDALKKAARQRAEEEADLGQLMPGASRAQAPRGAKKSSTQTIMLVGAAAVSLVVVSVVVTGILVTGKPDAAPAAARTVASLSPPPAPTPAPAPLVQVPVVALVSVPRAVAAAPTPVPTVEFRPAPTAVPTAAPTAAPTAVPTAMPTAMPTAIPTAIPTAMPTPAPTVALAAAPIISLQPPGPAAPVGATPADQAHNDLVQGLVDSLHVSGVLAAGTGSKALVDGHVYRINDVLDRRTGLRLVKADPDRLTFVDSAGVTYVKSF
ncbi:MAG TPA: hypothetical protein VN877_06570 [Opitutaceae bacterium]|nr:hypothetical protein [Opitutaceae bacterium]